jgi:hypothetical protein
MRRAQSIRAGIQLNGLDRGNPDPVQAVRATHRPPVRTQTPTRRYRSRQSTHRCVRQLSSNHLGIVTMRSRCDFESSMVTAPAASDREEATISRCVGASTNRRRSPAASTNWSAERAAGHVGAGSSGPGFVPTVRSCARRGCPSSRSRGRTPRAREGTKGRSTRRVRGCHGWGCCAGRRVEERLPGSWRRSRT